MNEIKAIETYYKGYRFRSRLEARWAVFFDALGIEYRYELEGFKLPDGKYYLPDFYLPEFNIYVEIKPSRELDDGKAESFGLGICNFDEGAPGGILICYGDPLNHDMRFVTACESNESYYGSYDTDVGIFVRNVRFEINRFEGVIIHISPDKKWERQFHNAKKIYTDFYYPGSVYYSEAVVKAAEEKARQARFEHGEKPVMVGTGTT